jgi:hypothetical protein
MSTLSAAKKIAALSFFTIKIEQYDAHHANNCTIRFAAKQKATTGKRKFFKCGKGSITAANHHKISCHK